MNIENPVAIPKGGMMIFFAETAVRDSLTRQTMTAIAPTIELTSDITLRGGIFMKNCLLDKEMQKKHSYFVPCPGAPPNTFFCFHSKAYWRYLRAVGHPSMTRKTARQVSLAPTA
jgi:hypothetical protein